jgi:transcriptional regulator with XRE-family HTH domain
MNFEQIVSDLTSEYSVKEIAEAAGVSAAYIYRIASGERKVINYAAGAALVKMHEQQKRRRRERR